MPSRTKKETKQTAILFFNIKESVSSLDGVISLTELCFAENQSCELSSENAIHYAAK